MVVSVADVVYLVGWLSADDAGVVVACEDGVADGVPVWGEFVSAARVVCPCHDAYYRKTLHVVSIFYM